MRWSVTRPNKDIAGFYVVIRDQHNQILVEHHVGYEKRTDRICGHAICDTECSNLELCVLTKNSYGTINGWSDFQCKYLPNNFENIREIYNDRNDKIYVIHSFRKKILGKSIPSTNDAYLYRSFFNMKFFAVYILLPKKLIFNYV